MMKILKKVVFIHLLMLLIQVCTTQNSQAPNKSTFKSFDVNYASAGVDVSKEENVQFQNGTNIKVPVNAFVDASGKTVKGKVEIEYRELKSASEIVASGIPTNYANSNKQQFETGGVVEVRAKSNGEAVYLAKSKKLEINLPKKIKAGQNLYHLENNGEQSSYLQSPLISQAYAQTTTDSRKWVLVYEGNQAQVGTNGDSSQDSSNTEPKTPLNNGSDGTFALKLNLQTAPELAKYKDTRWVFAGKKSENDPTTDKNQWVLNETWDALELVQNLFAPNVVLKGHTKSVATAIFSPDGSYLITASSDYTAKIWSVTGRLMTTLKGHKDFIRTAVFSKNNQYIVTASGDGTAKIWSKDGSLIRTLEGNKNIGVYAANFSPDGSKIVTGLEDGTAKIWSLEGDLVKTLKGHKQAVYSVEFSPNGKYILTASADKTAKVWTLDGKIVRDLKKHRKAIFSARFSSDGNKIVTASADKTARIWSIAGDQLHRLKHRKAVYAATFSPNNQYILTASEDNTAKLWDINGNKISTLRSQSSPFSYAVFSPNGRYILTASKDNTAKLWTKPELVPNTPFGLEMAGIEKENRPDHRFKFNGVENEQTFGLNWNETLFRTYDLQLGRWHQVDPEIDILEFQAPYVGLNNTPVMITDPDGDIGWLGAIIGGAVGFVYGVVKHGFKKGGWKKVIATTVGGAVAGATLNAGLGMATSAGLTGANMAYAVGASSIASVITGNLAEQGVNNLLGSQNGFNKQDFMASLVVSVPAAIVGPAAGAGGEKILKNITTKVTKKLTSNTSFQARKEFVKKQAKLLRRKAAQKGTPITSKQAKLAAEKMFDRVRRDKLEKGSKMWIDFTTKSVQIGTASTNKIFQDRMKVSQKKKD